MPREPRSFPALANRLPDRVIWSAAAMLLLATAAFLGGCSRGYYRRQADADVYYLVDEKSEHPHWPLNNYTIEINPGSRMFDPYSPDRPPMPVDDPVAHQLMHYIDGKRAWPWWHANGQTQFAENPAWLAYLPTDEQGFIRLNVNDAVRLALLQSTNYQQNLETLYLSALDVTFERFRLNTQFFAGHATTFTTDGPQRLGGGGQSSSTLSTATNPSSNGIRATRLGATGTTMVVGFANSLLWQYSGPDTLTARGLIDFSLLQPILQNAGRDYVLERLTIVERSLLYNVRMMERYRRGFYLNVVTGRNPGGGPTRRGGVFGGSGLQGFSGVGAGGFGQIVTTGGGGGFAVSTNGTAAGAAGAGGYMGLLQLQQQIRNLEFNIEGLKMNLYRLTNFRNAAHTYITTTETAPQRAQRILREELQVAQATQALNNAEGALINARNNYEQTLDNWKTSFGLPPQLCVKIQDPMLDQFKLISDETRARQTEINDLMAKLGDVNEKILAMAKSELTITGEGPQLTQTLKWTDALEAQLQQLEQYLEPLVGISEKIDKENLPPASADVDRFQEVMPRRKKAIVRLWRNFQCRRRQLCPLLPLAELDPTVFDPARLDEAFEQLFQERERLQMEFAKYSGRLEDLRQSVEKVLTASKKRELDRGAPDSQELYNEVIKFVDPETRELHLGLVLAVQKILIGLSDDTFSLQLLQARARSEAIELQPVELSSDTAFEIARKYRRDWMNARASLVDGWRLVQFNANPLEGGINLVFNGDMGNVGQNPLDFRKSTGRLQFGVQFDAPLTRLSERNTYRQALIEYQQGRRQFYQFRDGVSQTLRLELRTLEANSLNFELRRSAVRIAAQQIVINDAILETQAGQASGPTAARDAVSALTDLQNAQNDFLSVWVNYEVLRRSLDYDLGTMQLGPDGIWLDPGQIGDEDPCDPSSNCENCNPSAVDEDFLPGRAEGLEPGQPYELPVQPFEGSMPNIRPLLPAPGGPQQIPEPTAPDGANPGRTPPGEANPGQATPGGAIPTQPTPAAPTPAAPAPGLEGRRDDGAGEDDAGENDAGEGGIGPAITPPKSEPSSAEAQELQQYEQQYLDTGLKFGLSALQPSRKKGTSGKMDGEAAIQPSAEDETAAQATAAHSSRRRHAPAAKVGYEQPAAAPHVRRLPFETDPLPDEQARNPHGSTTDSRLLQFEVKASRALKPIHTALPEAVEEDNEATNPLRSIYPLTSPLR